MKFVLETQSADNEMLRLVSLIVASDRQAAAVSRQLQITSGESGLGIVARLTSAGNTWFGLDAGLQRLIETALTCSDHFQL